MDLIVDAAVNAPHIDLPYHCNIETRWAIIAHWKDGKCTDDISKKVNIGSRAVLRWIERYKETGTVEGKEGRGIYYLNQI